ncbi:MAG TPA: alkaline phosphatase [Thermoanaerobaculia bacterium]|jgi:alkaline phosphatase|nr:alkaline phosphatase [Thermoanaerobaculia bacterium]
MIHLIAAVLLAATTQPAPKNVILLIADGTGPAHMTVAKQARGPEFRIGTMPVIGLVTTPCADRNVTDSAAAATALASGVKTNYETVGQDPAGNPLTTVLDAAEKNGKATGLVTTGYFWDATPAAFAAHAKHRDDPTIPAQMLGKQIEVIAGSGMQRLGKDPLPSFDTLVKGSGYTIITAPEQLAAASGPRLLAVFQGQDRDMDVPDAPLPLLARWAIDRLDDDPDGFFLMIEHEGTDSSSHQNHVPDLRRALISFDEAVGVALDFAKQHGDTLVVVTGDHETGGMRVSEFKTGRFRVEWSTGDHTGTAIPVFAYGPGAAAFAGFQDNTDVGKKLIAAVSRN